MAFEIPLHLWLFWVFSLSAHTADFGLVNLYSCRSQFLIINLFLYIAYWFCFSGEPWLIHCVLLRLDHLCKLTAIQLRGPATVFFKTPGPGFPGGLVVKNSLPVQGTSVWSLVWKAPTSGGTAKPMCHNYWPSALEPVSHSCWSPGTWSPCSATRGVTAMRSLHTQIEISPHHCHD